MKKNRSLPTRRKRAVKWGIALCAVLVVNYLIGLYCVTPGQALRQVSARYGLSPMKIWTTLDMSQAKDGEKHCILSYNDDYLVFSTAHFDVWKGWSAEPLVLVPDTGEPVSVGEIGYCKKIEQGYETVYLFFGGIHDPDVTAVEMAVRHASLTEDAEGLRLKPFPWQRTRISSGDLQTVGGRRVFLAVLDPVYDPGGSTYPESDIRFFRENGTEESVPEEHIATGLKR